MARSVPLIRSSLLSEFTSLVKELDGPLLSILEAAELNLEQIEQPTLMIPLAKHINLLEIASRRCNCEAFALELARRQDLAAFGALSLLVVQAGTVRSGLQIFRRNLHYSVQAVEVTITEEREQVFFRVETPFDFACRSAQFWDFAIALSCSGMRMMCGQSWAPEQVYLRRHKPARTAPFDRHFRSPVIFDGEFSGLVFGRNILEQPISESLSTVPGRLQTYLRNSLEGDFLEQVRHIITVLLPTRDCSARTVAQCLGYSLRSMQRQLRAEETSFQKQRDRVRSELAIIYLQEPRFNLVDIAELLGFADASVLTHSFKRCFGVTPSQWRGRKFDMETRGQGA